MRYEREGYCCRCGDCCRGNPDGSGTDKDLCPFLRFEADGKAACVDWDKPNTYWAKGCIVWPTKPEHIAHLPRCTYWFREVPDGS